MAKIPAIGDLLTPRDGTHVITFPGIVVDVSIIGMDCVLARIHPKTNKVIESVHAISDLKGPMTGVLVTPKTLKYRWRG